MKKQKPEGQFLREIMQAMSRYEYMVKRQRALAAVKKKKTYEKTK